MALAQKQVLSPAKKASKHGPFWFVARGAEMKGPYSSEQLQEELKHENFHAGDFCWTQGFHEWRPICSLEELGFSQKPCLLAPYPSVAVPAPAPKATSTASSNAQKVVKVRLYKDRSFHVGFWERIFLVFFAIALAYTSTWVALDEIKDQFASRLERFMGLSPQTLGQVSSEGLALDFVAPMLSAPGFTQVNSQWMPVHTNITVPESDKSQAEKSGAYEVQYLGAGADQVLEGFQKPQDPIYIKRVEAHGILDVSDKVRVRVKLSGYPGL